jgi:hypothetical protein
MICFCLALALPLFAASTLAVFDTIRRRRELQRIAATSVDATFHERDTLPSIEDERPTLPTLETERAEALARFKP